MIDLVNAVVRKSLRHDLARLTRFKAGREGIETFIKVTQAARMSEWTSNLLRLLFVWNGRDEGEGS